MLRMHFDESDWERIERAWTAWWAGDLDRPLVMIESLDPSAGEDVITTPSFIPQFPAQSSAEEIIARYGRRLEALRFYGDAWPKWSPNFGPGIMAAALGANVRSAPDTVWFEPVEGAGHHDATADLDSQIAWRERIRHFTQLAIQHWGKQVGVGFTDLGCNLDILAAVRGTQRLLFDLYDAPEEVGRTLVGVTCLWRQSYDELYQIIGPQRRGTSSIIRIWSPGRCYCLQSDFSYMISPEMFERFVMPDLAECCSHLDHAFYHLDGKEQISHLDMLLSLDTLHGIQWDPGDTGSPPEEWLPLLKRIRDAGKLCHVAVTPQGAKTIVQSLGGKGFAFVIIKQRRTSTVAAPPRFSEDEACDLIRMLTDYDGNR